MIEIEQEKLNRILEDLSTKDKVMASLIQKHPKFSHSIGHSPFQSLIRQIISQQLSVKAANTIYSRFIEIVGKQYSHHVLMEYDIEDLKQVGLSYLKSSYILNLSGKLVENPTFLHDLKDKSDKEVISELTKIKGIGIWTAQMFLMFTLRRLDVLPLNDIGLQNGLKRIYLLQNKPSEQQIISITSNWIPYRTIGCWYVWKELDNPKL